MPQIYFEISSGVTAVVEVGTKAAGARNLREIFQHAVELQTHTIARDGGVTANGRGPGNENGGVARTRHHGGAGKAWRPRPVFARVFVSGDLQRILDVTRLRRAGGKSD